MTDKVRVALAGSVTRSRVVLEALISHKAPIAGVLGLSAGKSTGVSGYCRLDDLAEQVNAPYQDFKSINAPEIVKAVAAWSPDVLFVVGLSQLVSRVLLDIPRLGCVGFHPTWLPRGRGRAPLAWLTYDGEPGAATFFLMTEEADAGSIFVQEPFWISEDEHAAEVGRKVDSAIRVALDRWLPELLSGVWDPAPQDESRVTFNGRRCPEDGVIHWERPAREVYALIRACSHPHPGAYTYLAGRKILVWRAERYSGVPYRGGVGRILAINNGRMLVQTGDVPLWVSELDSTDGDCLPLRIGSRLGYEPQDEVHSMQTRLVELEEEVRNLTILVSSMRSR